MQVAVWVILFASVFPKRKTQHRRGEQEGEENKTMFIFDRRLGAAVAEGVTKGCSQKEGVVEGAARGRRQHWHLSLL